MEKCGLTARISSFPLTTLSKSFLERRRRRGIMLYRELCAALSAAAQQDRAAGWRSGACAEPVGLRALAFLWLIGALRHVVHRIVPG